MNRPQVLLALAVTAASTGLLGCGASDEIIVDRMVSIADGAGHSFKLEPGRYKVDVTASDDGVTVKFIGCSCPGSEHETQAFSSICELTQTGQVVLDNPTILGSGAGSTVTVKITKLAGS